MKSIIYTAALLLASPSWAVNKCTAADGTVTFQDAPCASGQSKAVKVWSTGPAAATSAPAMNTSVSATTGAAPLPVPSRAQINQAIVRGEPLVGMTRAELDRAMGAPTKVNANNYAGRQNDQIIYERPTATWLVYTDAGIVTSIQHRPAAVPVASGGHALPCPSALEIRNMETSASSNTIPEAVRVEMLRQIRDAKKCGK
jgi:hypothetical protein